MVSSSRLCRFALTESFSPVNSVWVSGCVCWLPLARWSFLLGSILGLGNCLKFDVGGWEVMPLDENTLLGLLAWFPAQVRLRNGLRGFLDSLVRLTTHLGLGTIFSKDGTIY